MIRIMTLSFLIFFSSFVFSDELALLRLGLEQRQQLNEYLENTPCACGCGMTAGYCLREDPACEMSPEMARQALAQLTGASSAANHNHSHHSEPASSGRGYINQSQNGSVVSGRNSDGQECTYASVGGTTVRMCD